MANKTQLLKEIGLKWELLCFIVYVLAIRANREQKNNTLHRNSIKEEEYQTANIREKY